MKIEKIRLRHVFGTIETDGRFWEERLVQPLDVYPEFRDTTKRVEWNDQTATSEIAHDAYFVQIETDEGVTGWGESTCGPSAVVDMVNEFGGTLVGKDPGRIEEGTNREGQWAAGVRSESATQAVQGDAEVHETDEGYVARPITWKSAGWTGDKGRTGKRICP